MACRTAVSVGAVAACGFFMLSLLTMKVCFRRLMIPALAALGVFVPALGRAQAPAWTATRAEIEQRLAVTEANAQSPAYEPRTRTRATLEATRLRERLEVGDFKVGDRVFLAVDGALTFSDTVTVLQGQRIAATGIGEISLRGVLRSELQQHAARAIEQVVRNSRVTARPLVRVAVFGSVGSPGYLTVPMETRLDELVMIAGGPASDAATGRIRVMRGEAVVLDEDEVRSAIENGVAIAALGLVEGDQLVVRRGPQPWDRQQWIQVGLTLVTPVIFFLLNGRR